MEKRKSLGPLRYREDVRTLVWEVIYFSLVVVEWLYFYELSGWAKAVFFVVIALFSFFGATITHNCIHVPIFKTQRLNSLFQVVLTHTYGHPVSALIPGHNLSHHKFTNAPKDVMRPQKMRHKIHLLNLLTFPIVIARDINKRDMAYFQAQRRANRPVWRQYLLEAALFYPVQLTLVMLDWRRFLAVIFLPQAYAKWQIISMNLLQHDGCPEPEVDRYNHSRNFVGSCINYFTFNNGYHTVHHLNPGFHWTRLPSEHRKLLPHMHPALNQNNILTYTFRTFFLPNGRRTFDGKPYVLPPPCEDEDWYDGTAETYSSAPPASTPSA